MKDQQTKLYNFQPGCPPLKVVPPADRRGAQMKAPSERAPRGKYAGGVLEMAIFYCYSGRLPGRPAE